MVSVAMTSNEKTAYNKRATPVAPIAVEIKLVAVPSTIPLDLALSFVSVR